VKFMAGAKILLDAGYEQPRVQTLRYRIGTEIPGSSGINKNR